MRYLPIFCLLLVSLVSCQAPGPLPPQEPNLASSSIPSSSSTSGSPRPSPSPSARPVSPNPSASPQVLNAPVQFSDKLSAAEQKHYLLKTEPGRFYVYRVNMAQGLRLHYFGLQPPENAAPSASSDTIEQFFQASDRDYHLIFSADVSTRYSLNFSETIPIPGMTPYPAANN